MNTINIQINEISDGNVIDEPLAGAYMKVTAEDGTVVASWQTEVEPYQLKNLDEGVIYTLSELVPPVGHYMAAAIEFTIVEGQVYVIENGEMIPSGNTITMYSEKAESTGDDDEITRVDNIISSEVRVNGEAGFYTSDMDEFSLDRIGTVIIDYTHEVYDVDKNGEIVNDYGELVISKSIINVNYGEQTPASVFDENNETMKYEIQLYDSIGKELEGGVVTVYIGKKGDVNFDGKVGIDDAAKVLEYYAKAAANLPVSFTEDAESPYEILAFLLADTNTQSTVGSNSIFGTIEIIDVSNILTYYAKQSAGLDVE